MISLHTPHLNIIWNLKLLEQDFWMSILLDVGNGLEINVLTSKFILLGYQMLGEMGCHPEICFYGKFHMFNQFFPKSFSTLQAALVGRVHNNLPEMFIRNKLLNFIVLEYSYLENIKNFRTVWHWLSSPVFSLQTIILHFWNLININLRKNVDIPKLFILRFKLLTRNIVWRFTKPIIFRGKHFLPMSQYLSNHPLPGSSQQQ